MQKIKDFFNKYKATIISILSAILTFAIAISGIDMGARIGIIVSIVIVIVPIMLSILNGDDMNTTVQLLVNAITVIQQIVKESQSTTTEEQVVSANPNREEVETAKAQELTEEEIRELITKGL